MLRIWPAQGAQRLAESTSFLKVDPRKKQVTLYDPATGPPGCTGPRHATAAAIPKMFAFDAVFPQDSEQVRVTVAASGGGGAFSCRAGAGGGGGWGGWGGGEAGCVSPSSLASPALVVSPPSSWPGSQAKVFRAHAPWKLSEWCFVSQRCSSTRPVCAVRACSMVCARRGREGTVTSVCACTLRVPVSCVWLVHAVSVCVSMSGPCVSCVHVEIFVSLVLGALPATSWTHCLYVMRQKWREPGGCLTLCLSPRPRSARGQWPTCFSRWSVGPMAAFSPLAT